MGQEREKVRQVKRMGHVKSGIRKRKCGGTKLKRPVPEVPKALQELFVSCRRVFRGPGTVPLPLEVDKLCRILDDMKAQDFGLNDALEFPVTGRVTYTTIYKCDNFSLCIFFIPATGVIPLHNHPGMTVFSKLLFGRMHIKSYDWVEPADSDNSHPPSIMRLARLKADKVFEAPCSTSVLYPTTGGNIHAFTAVTFCAVLDVLGPPYSKEDGRDCSYYKDYPYSAFSNGETLENEEKGERYVWLEEINPPENSEMDGIEYLGPQIKVNRRHLNRKRSSLTCQRSISSP